MTVATVVQALSWPWWLLITLGASSSILGGNKSDKREKDHRQISHELERERREKATAQKALSEAIEGVGINLSEELGLWSPKVRFTIYAHDDIEHTFVPIVRSSDNPTLAKKNRKSYPDSQGYLGIVWKRGECSHMRKQERTVKAESLDLGFTEEQYRNLTLKPRSLKGIRLSNGKQHIGAILWESEDPKRINTRDTRLDDIKDNATFLDLQAVFAASTLLFSDLSEHFFEKSG